VEIMHDLRLSDLFLRYRREGDLSALAKLFDALSPEMMRVARHVAGRGIDPEDVVQSTFLASIERAETFDAERPIVPWLMGILINQARLTNRRRATRHEESSEHAATSAAAELDAAEANEVQDAVARALADLPPTYREVLVAHLAEGKQPHEIARELGRPQGTVRAQL
jgi:RNA polymerase sigma-70 factor (ECF subfamily)